MSTEDDDYLTHQRQRECSATQASPGWRHLVEHFAHVHKQTVEQIMATTTDDAKRRDLVMREAGRRDVIEWFAREVTKGAPSG